MKNEIMQRLEAVNKTLGNIEVKGKNNLMNLSGCIMVVEELIQIVQALPDEPAVNAPAERGD